MPKKNSEYWGEKFAKLHHLPGEKRRAAEAPKDFFQKKFHQIHHMVELIDQTKDFF
jgi:DNA-binding transcriptional regulator GbsR (MarR family)